MAKFRSHTRDINPEVRKPDTKPGELSGNRIGVYDHRGRRRGFVHGHGASENVARRFGVDNAKLGTKDGKPAWIGSKPERVARVPNTKHAHQLAQAKGSVSKTPSPPVTSARPKRG